VQRNVTHCYEFYVYWNCLGFLFDAVVVCKIRIVSLKDFSFSFSFCQFCLRLYSVHAQKARNFFFLLLHVFEGKS
jgi:hypothetical protein